MSSDNRLYSPTLVRVISPAQQSPDYARHVLNERNESLYFLDLASTDQALFTLHQGSDSRGDIYGSGKLDTKKEAFWFGLGDPSRQGFKAVNCVKKGTFSTAWKFSIKSRVRGEVHYSWKSTKIEGENSFAAEFSKSKTNIKLVDESTDGVVAVLYNDKQQGRFEFHEIVDLDLEILSLMSGLLLLELSSR